MTDDFTVNDMKPTARAVKDQEMSIRRAYELNASLLKLLDVFGTVQKLKEQHRHVILSDNKLRKLFPGTSIEWRHPEAWEWVITHWYSGALKRSVQVSLLNITDTNRKNIKNKVDELHE